ncbi:MAG: hypothetical protein KY428_10930 [Bacteroidetes bacterium]|nr:hypothetical protein [Bacteroidota bacterium]
MTTIKMILEHWLDGFPITKQAKLLGLEYAGYGRWKDMETGKIVAKTVGEKLYFIQGVGKDAPISPADLPNSISAEPTAGDSVDGHNNRIKAEHDPYMEMSPKMISHMYRDHGNY